MPETLTVKTNGSRLPRGLLLDANGKLIPTQVDRILNTGYSNYGANRTKNSMAAWYAAGGSPDDDIIGNIQLLRERSRDCFMGIPLARAAIETLSTNTVGPGLVAQPSVDGVALGLNEEQATTLKLELAKKFAWWAENPRECDFEARHSFYALQALCLETCLLSGDTPVLFHLKPRPGSIFELRIRLLESDRVCDAPYGGNGNGYGLEDEEENGRLYGGVELDSDGEVVAYHVARQHPLSYRAMLTGYNLELTRVPVYGEESGRRNMLLVMRAERPEQRRGVPLLAVVLEMLKQMGRYIDSATVAALIQSYFTAWIQSDWPNPDMYDDLIPASARGDLAWLSPYNVQLGPGLVNFLKPGQSVEFGNPGQPSPAFPDFVVGLTKFIGAALGIPYEILLKQFNASYSASRAALLEFHKRVRKWRSFLVEQFCQPCYEEWLADALALGRIENFRGDSRDPYLWRALSACNWMGLAAGSIDPYKEALASEKKINLLVSSVERESAELNGSDWLENIQQGGRELAACEAQGLIYPGVRTAQYK